MSLSSHPKREDFLEKLTKYLDLLRSRCLSFKML